MKFLNILKEWKEELWSIPVAFLVFFLSPYFLRWIDPTAGTYDAGIFQIILFAVICLLVFNGLAWLGIKVVFPEVFKWFQGEFSKDFNSSEITKWQRIKISLCLYLAFLFALVVLARVI